MSNSIPEDKRDPRRLFTAAEKLHLYHEQGARCPNCHGELHDDLQAHHVMAHADGGATTLDNAVLLCEPCHRLVHRSFDQAALTTVTGLPARAWQVEAVQYTRPFKTATVVACPAAGKTFAGGFWLRDQKRVREDGRTPFVIVVSPSRSVRQGWQQDVTRHFGIQLADDWNGGAINRDQHGVSICYASLKPRLVDTLKMHAQHRGVLAIFDEIHHAGDNVWGDGVEDVLRIATRSLLLTGTPFRTGGGEIRGLTYNADAFVVPNFSYGYRKAIRDNVCRSVRFRFFDGAARFVREGEERVLTPSETDEASQSNVANTLYADDSAHLEELIRISAAELDAIRATKPDAACLFVCRPAGNHQETSAEEDTRVERVARRVRHITGEQPVVVTSRDEKAQRKLDDFRHGGGRFLVAINMVSEGVNIPRLQVACPLRHIQSPLLFRQLFGPGRVGRQTPGKDTEEAVVVLSSFPSHKAEAAAIETEVREALAQKKDKRIEDGAEQVERKPNPAYDFLPISATAIEDVTISREQEYNPALAADTQRVQAKLLERTGRQVPFDVAAAAMDLLGKPAIAPQEPVVDVAAEEKSLRKRLSKIVARHAHATGRGHKDIFNDVYKACGYRHIGDVRARGGNDGLRRCIAAAETLLRGAGVSA